MQEIPLFQRPAMPAYTTNNALVAILTNVADFEIAHSEHWYRIPLKIKQVPKVLKEGRLQFLAFYHSRAFGKQAYSIRYVATVKRISIVKRKDLVPFPETSAAQDQWRKKAEEDYYKIEISPLRQLPHPIISRKWRRIVFIETTDHKLFAATEINDLFRGNHLEEKLYQALKDAQVPVERQFHVQVNQQHCFLDFAVFCSQGKLNIECDGGYHDHMPLVDIDRGRNNLLQSAGWSVLRFSANDVYNHPEKSLALVAETIARYGGLP